MAFKIEKEDQVSEIDTWPFFIFINSNSYIIQRAGLKAQR